MRYPLVEKILASSAKVRVEVLDLDKKEKVADLVLKSEDFSFSDDKHNQVFQPSAEIIKPMLQKLGLLSAQARHVGTDGGAEGWAYWWMDNRKEKGFSFHVKNPEAVEKLYKS